MFTGQDYLNGDAPKDKFKDARDFTKIRKEVSPKITDMRTSPKYINTTDQKLNMAHGNLVPILFNLGSRVTHSGK